MRLLPLFLLIAPLALPAEDPALAAPFTQRGLTGTIVLTSLKSNQTFIHNAPRARQRFIAASTFKIPNTLIGLEERAVENENSPFAWDGARHEFPDHNRDQTLRSAFRVSCVWCYRIIARRVGPERYRHHLRQMNYGRLTEPFDVANFWLDGSLTLSALEQIDFLRKLHRREFPFSRHAYDTLAAIMIADSGPGYTLRAKTGWSGRDPQTGWYVGIVETPSDTWFFATNILVRSPADLPERIALTREALAAKGILPR
jgi:beta-lactamase class D